MAVKPPALLHKMSLTHQRNWYSKNDPGNMPAHLTTSVAKSKSAKVDPVKTKARERMSLKAYGATKGTKVGEIGGEKPAADKDTIAPLTRDQHSKVQAAKRTAPLSKDERIAAISRAARKSQTKYDVPTEDHDDHGHDDMMDLHHSLHVGRGQYNEEVEQVNEMDSEGYKGHRDDDVTKATHKATPITRKAMAKAALKALQGTPVVSLNDLSAKETGRKSKSLKVDDPRVKFHKEEVINKDTRMSKIDEVNSRHSYDALSAALTPTSKQVKASLGKTKRDLAFTQKHARRIAKISNGDYTKQEVKDNLRSLANEETEMSDPIVESLQEMMNEKAPPGAKYERMVKHIKANYSKDGKLSAKEKAIAYATAWKAKKANKEAELDEASNIDKLGKKYAKAEKGEAEKQDTYSKKYPGGNKQKEAAKAAFMKRFANEEVEQIDENFDKSSPAHKKARELVGGFGRGAKAKYHADGSATIHTKGNDDFSSVNLVDHLHDKAGLGYNRPAKDYVNSSRKKDGLTFKTTQTAKGYKSRGSDPFETAGGTHEIHISHSGVKEEVDLKARILARIRDK